MIEALGLTVTDQEIDDEIKQATWAAGITNDKPERVLATRS